MNELHLLLDTPRYMALFAVVLEIALIGFALAQPRNKVRDGFILSTIFGASYLLGGAMSGAMIRTQVTATDYLSRSGGECQPVNDLPICHQDTLDLSLISQSCLEACQSINEFQVLLSAENWMRFCFFFVYLLPYGAMYFYYALGSKGKDSAYQLIKFICFFLATVSVFSEKIRFRGEWSTPVLMFVFLPCYIYCINVMWRIWWHSETRHASKRNGLILISVFFPIVSYTILDLILDKSLNVLTFDPFYVHAVNGCLLTSIIAIAITKYGLFNLDLERAAEDLFQNMNDPVMLIRDNLTVARANPAAQNFFGIPEISNAEQRLYIQSLLPHFDAISPRFDSKIAFGHSHRTYSCSNSLVSREGQSNGHILIMRDVTRERELSTMKTEFTSTVSHELRTPLTSILGFARIIQKRLQEVILPQIDVDSKKEQRVINQVGANLSVVIQEGQRLTEIINDVLDISKMEAGKLEWNFESISINDLVKQSSSELVAEINAKGVAFELSLDEGLPSVVADPERISQIIRNLMRNALKFTDTGRIMIKSAISNGEVDISVKDTGIGIEAQDKIKIFQKYHQLGEVLTDKPTGTGLGLPICREIIERHGGKIWVESLIDVGSSFFFSLPLPLSKVIDTDTIQLSTLLDQWHLPNQQIATDALPTVLIVEDEFHIRQLLKQALEPTGVMVIEATDGLDGLNKIRAAPPSLVLVDVMMPKLNGFEMVAALKNDPSTMNLPIVMLTVVDEMQRAFGLGVDRYLKKPIEPEKVVDEVHSLLNRQNVSKNALFIGDPGYGASDLKTLLQASNHSIFQISDLAAMASSIEGVEIHLVLVQASDFNATSVTDQLKKHIDLDNVLVRFISNDV